MSQAKNWCFTLNGPEFLEGKSSLESALDLPRGLELLGLSYCIFQLERGVSGTDHLQGYCQFNSRKSLRQVKAIDQLPGAHWEVAKGTAKQNKAYCTKEDTRIDGPWEYGTMTNSGKRTDIEDFVAAMPMTEAQILESYPQILAKYPNFVKRCIRQCFTRQPEPFYPRNEWQVDLVSYCLAPAHPRKVRWYCDYVGNSGKSYFCRHFGFGQRYVVTGGKHADIFHAYSYEPFIFFDWPRCHEETIPYGVIESFKNGYFLSTKYESAPVSFATPIVIVFANFDPDLTKLSHDRWEIINIKN